MSDGGLQGRSVEVKLFGQAQQQHDPGGMDPAEHAALFLPANLRCCFESLASDAALESVRISYAESIVVRAVFPLDQVRFIPMPGHNFPQMRRSIARFGRQPDAGCSVSEGTDALPIRSLDRQRVGQSGSWFYHHNENVSNFRT